MIWLALVLGAIALILFLVQRSLRRVTIFDYERGLLYRNGVFQRVLEPGAYTHGAATSITRVDLRPRTIAVPSQEILSADSVSLKISLAAQFGIADPLLATHATQSYLEALYLYLQLALREQVSAVPVEQLLAARQAIGAALLERVAPQAAAIGLALQSVQIKDITFPGDLKRVFAQVLTAQKEGQAALERARGESAALRNLANSARLLDNNPSLLQLRALVAASQSSGNTIVFNVPLPQGPQQGDPPDTQAPAT